MEPYGVNVYVVRMCIADASSKYPQPETLDLAQRFNIVDT